MRNRFKNLQRLLRKNMPAPERILWQKIRDSQLGIKFRRQFTIENFILDFYAPMAKLGIEADGESHFESKEVQNRDSHRDAVLFQKGIKILRFLNPEIMNNLDGVLAVITDEIKERI